MWQPPPATVATANVTAVAATSAAPASLSQPLPLLRLLPSGMHTKYREGFSSNLERFMTTIQGQAYQVGPPVRTAPYCALLLCTSWVTSTLCMK